MKMTALHLPRSAWFIFAGLFMAFILYTSTQPAPHIQGVNPSLVDHALDFAHFPVYSFLTLLLILAFGFEIHFQVLALVVVILFGALNEFVQMGTPGRSCSVKDEIVNILGALLTIFCLHIFRKKSA